MKKRIFIALGLLSFSIIAFQLVLMQVLSIVQWSHFSFMVISVALLGFGASGTLLALFKSTFIKYSTQIIPASMFICGFLISITIFLTQNFFPSFDTFLIFSEQRQVFYLILNYLLYFLPFFFGAVAIGLIYVKHIQEITKLYFFDLFGAGLGGFVVLILMWLFLPSKLINILGLLPIIAGFILITNFRYRTKFILYIVVSVLYICTFTLPSKLNYSEYKSLSKTLNMKDSEIIYTEHSPYGLIEIITSPVLRYAPGLSLNYFKEIHVRDFIFVNGDFAGPIIKWERSDTSFFLDYTVFGLPYYIKNVEKSLILDAGTGLNVAHSLSSGARAVTAIEYNKPLTNLLQTTLANEIDSLYSHPNVNLINQFSRHYIKTSKVQYDLIVFPTIDVFGGSAGVNSISEQYLYTVESFNEAWELLSDDGMLFISCWIDYPYRNPLRLIATAVTMLKIMGIDDVVNHIIAIRTWGSIGLVISKKQVNEEQISKTREFCNSMSFDPLILKALNNEERTQYNLMQDENLFELIDKLLSDDYEHIIENYDFNITPINDQKPYFYQYLKPLNIKTVIETYGNETFFYLEVGYIFIIFTFVQILVISFVLILLPLFKLKRKGSGKFFGSVYFACLGLGYMFLEIVLIQKYILYFGNPIYSAAIVISCMLIFTGIGSYFSTKLVKNTNTLLKYLLLIAILILILSFIIGYLTDITIGFNIIIKIFFALIITAPLAFVMGIPFPTGLKILSSKNETLIPWAWGINGFFSVISTVGATILAIEYGFILVIQISAILYIVALLTLFFSFRKNKQINLTNINT